MATQSRDVESAAAATGDVPGAVTRASPYSYYALILLILANLFNYMDRTIVSILGPQMQKDLHLTDTQLGFLLGTAFAVLFGVIGIPMGRIADALNRTRLMAVGLAVWSAMTALSGFARGFPGIAAARVGVGLGEATASPVSVSILCDYFPARNRAAVLGAYLASVHFGIGAALVIGGLLTQKWTSWCSAFPAGACALPAWRAAFFLVGLPGLVLAILVAFLREPPRARPLVAVSPARVVASEMGAAIPPFTVFTLYGVSGARAATKNVVFAALLAAAAVLLSLVTGDWVQWVALAIGVYSVASWAQVLRFRDLPLFRLTFGSHTFMYAIAGGSFVACFVATLQVWAAPYAIRTLHVSPLKAGIALGMVSLGAAAVSTVAGGFIADRWKRRDRRAPLWLALISITVPVPFLFVMLHAQTLGTFVGALAVITLTGVMWSAPFAALAQDLILPRMRGTTSAIFALVIGLSGLAIGPYMAGKISTVTGSLATGLYGALVFVPIAIVLLLLAAKRLPQETAERRRALAIAAGEPA